MWGFLRKPIQLSFNILICVEKDGDGFYAHCPSLKGLHVDGVTKEEALNNARVATMLYIQSLIKHGDPIPLQIVQNKELKEHCEIGSHGGKHVIKDYPKTELVQVCV